MIPQAYSVQLSRHAHRLFQAPPPDLFGFKQLGQYRAKPTGRKLDSAAAVWWKRGALGYDAVLHPFAFSGVLPCP